MPRQAESRLSSQTLGIEHASAIMGNHYVPQYYLHGFASEGRMWAHDRLESEVLG